MKQWRVIIVIFSMVGLLNYAQINSHAITNFTDVGGPIISDTTWFLENSPYIVSASVEVWDGVTLTML